MYRGFLFLTIVLSGFSIACSQETTDININQEWSRIEVEEVTLSDGNVKARTESRGRVLTDNVEVRVAVDTYQRIGDAKQWSEYKWIWQVYCKDLNEKVLSKSSWNVVATKNTEDFTWIAPSGGGDKAICPIGFQMRINKKGRDFLVVIDQRKSKEQVVGVFVIEENGDLNLDPTAEELKSWKSIEKSRD